MDGSPSLTGWTAELDGGPGSSRPGFLRAREQGSLFLSGQPAPRESQALSGRGWPGDL